MDPKEIGWESLECGSGYGQVVCCRENGNQTAGFIIFWKRFDY
jgi:hypothetical protein